jgi:hypothetical protein
VTHEKRFAEAFHAFPQLIRLLDVQFLGGEYDTKRLEAEKAVKEADELREGMESFREDSFDCNSLDCVFASRCQVK